MSAAGPSTDASDAVERGRALLRQRKLDEAMACFMTELEERPLSIDANEGAATIAYLRRDFETAASHFEAAARADARRAEPLINLGATQNRLKEFGKAIKTLQKALSRDRKNSDAYFNLGVAYKGAGQLSMASNAYKESIRLRSDFAEAHQNLGLVYLESGNPRQARTSLQRALDLCPTLKRAQAGLQRAAAASNANDPFGRLLNSVAPTQSVTTGRINLSEAERSADRTQVVELAGRLERSLSALATEVRGTTEPLCQQTCRSVADSSTTPIQYAELTRELQKTLGECGHLLQLVDEHISALQQHESEIASKMRATS